MSDQTWLPIGEQLLDRDRATREGHNWTTRDEIEKGIARLEWVDRPESGIINGPMSPVLGIGAAIDQLDLRRVVAYAIDGYVTAWDDAESGTGTATGPPTSTSSTGAPTSSRSALTSLLLCRHDPAATAAAVREGPDEGLPLGPPLPHVRRVARLAEPLTFPVPGFPAP
jgi:hypothetical protein